MKNRIVDLGLTSSDVVIDLGANVGNVTTLLRSTGARVFAFEPDPAAFSILQERFSNDIGVVCFQKAVSDYNGETQLFHHELSKQDRLKYSTGSSLCEDKNNVNSKSSTLVRVIDITEFIERLPTPIKLLKIDIEGEEHKVLSKLIDSGLAAKIDHILVETHEDKVPSCREGMAKVREKILTNKLDNIKLDWI